jgi:hypothetical protein
MVHMSQTALTSIGRLGALVVILLPAAHAWAETAWALHLRAPKAAAHVLGEPVVVQVELVNTGDAARQIQPDLRNLTQSAEYFVTPHGGSPRRVDLGIVHDPSGATFRLSPGRSIFHDEVLLLDSGSKTGLAFPSPGRYTVHARWTDYETGRQVDSNAVEIEVVRPEGRLVELSEAVVGRAEVLRALQAVGMSPAAREKLKWMAASNTPFARIAALRLAEAELRGSEFGLPEEESLRRGKERLQRAVGWLNIADSPDSPLHGRALLLKGEVELDRGELAAAKAYYERVRQEFPRSAPAGTAVQRLGELAARAKAQP